MPILKRPGGTVVVYVAITLHPGVDAVLIAALQAAPPGQLAATARELMRHGAQVQPETGIEEPDLTQLGTEI